jgi:ribosomal protein S6--L-glutamate ligase
VNIGILSRRPALYSTRRLREAVQSLGHTPQVIDPMHCVLVLAGDAARIELEGQAVAGLDVVIPRVGSFALEYGIAVVQHFQLQGIPTLNEPASIALAKNKLASLQRLQQRRVPVPDTALVRWPGHIRDVVRQLGGPPVVLKTLRGSQGAGVILAESIEAVESILDTLWTFGQDAVIQRFVAE